MEQHPGAEEMKFKILKSHKKSALFSSKGHCTLLHCCTAVLSSGQDCTVYTGKSWSFRPAALLSHVPTAMGSLLAGLYHSLVLLLLMVQGSHLCKAAVWVIQTDSSACSCFLSAWHLPHKYLQSLHVCDCCQALTHWQCLSGQVMSPPSTLTRGRFKGAHCHKYAYSWVVIKHIAHFSDNPSFGCCLSTVLSFYSSGNSLKL